MRPVAAGHGTEAIIPTEQERLRQRMDDIRSMLRDARSLDVIETLVLALADLEQRLKWVEGERANDDGAAPEGSAT